MKLQDDIIAKVRGDSEQKIKKRVQEKKKLLQRCNIMEMLEEERDKEQKKCYS